MISVRSKARKWGNSLGFTIPISKAKTIGIKPGDTIDVFLEKENKTLSEVFGTLKFKKSTSKMLKESDKILYNE